MCESCNSLVILLFSATSIKEREESNVLPFSYGHENGRIDVLPLLYFESLYHCIRFWHSNSM